MDRKLQNVATFNSNCWMVHVLASGVALSALSWAGDRNRKRPVASKGRAVEKGHKCSCPHGKSILDGKPVDKWPSACTDGKVTSSEKAC